MVASALAAAAMGALSTGASNWDMGGMVSGLGTSGRGAKVDQKFQKLFSQIDYKIQRQELHRDDLRDLVDLTVSRMDMYNVVGALLLTFALQWVVDNSVVSAEKEYYYWPRWFSTIFIVHCFSSAGYLLFSLCFSMHCSIVSKAQGAKLLLHFARLSIPVKEEIEKMKVRFYSAGRLAKLAERWRSREKGAARSSTDNPFEEDSSDDSDDAHTAKQPRPSFCEHLADDELLNDSDTDFQRHLRMWVKERGKWLSYDAYARACMVVGLNQLLAALCYDLIASLWDVSGLSTFLCVMLSKLLSYHIYQIDVSISSVRQGLIYFFGDFLPPLVAFPLILIMPPKDTHEDKTVHRLGIMEVWSMPLFVLNSVWMLNVACQLRESTIRGNGAGSETDSESSSESMSDGGKHWRRSDGGFQDGRCQDGTENLPYAFLGRSFVGRHARSLYQVFYLDRGFVPAPGEDWFDHTPARIVRSFTLLLAVWWLVAGAAHVLSELFLGDFRVTHEPGESRLHMQDLSVPWPKPAGVFEVEALHCAAGSDMLVRGRFMTYRTAVLPNATLASFLPVEGGVAALLCGAEGCDALARLGASWSVLPLAELCSSSGPNAPPQPVPIPASWRVMAGAWEASGARRQAVLAGWDGGSIAVSGLRRDANNGSWLVEPRFRLHPGIGHCSAGEAACSAWRTQKYEDIRALQFGSAGGTLAVFDGRGWLDAWSLEQGELVGRWRLGGNNFTAMCHNGTQLYASRIGAQGPLLETAALPMLMVAEWLRTLPANGSSAPATTRGRLLR